MAARRTMRQTIWATVEIRHSRSGLRVQVFTFYRRWRPRSRRLPLGRLYAHTLMRGKLGGIGAGVRVGHDGRCNNQLNDDYGMRREMHQLTQWLPIYCREDAMTEDWRESVYWIYTESNEDWERRWMVTATRDWPGSFHTSRNPGWVAGSLNSGRNI